MTVQSGFFWDETFICSTSAALGPHVAGAADGLFQAVSLSTGILPASVGGVPPVILTASASQGVNGVIGVLQNDPKVGQAAIVRLLGSTKMMATTSAAVTYGALIASSTAGFAMVADTSGQRVIGVCIAASTGLVLGSLVEVLMFPRPIAGLV